MSEVKVNKISPRTNCGTVQLGDSGDTITIPAGATITNSGTQTGFGRNGTVNWQTSIKTANFTAVSGEGYFCDTSSGAFTLTLPASPSAGAIVSFSDYAKTFDTNNLTIGRNSSNIAGEAKNSIISIEGIAITLVYADSTKGWIVTESGLQSEAPGPEYIAATGGTVTTVCTNFKVHTFTGPGTFCVSAVGNPAGSNTVDYLVVAGGGAGGSANGGGAGGGAGGLRYSASTYCSPAPAPSAGTALPVSVQGYPIAVGAAGASATVSPEYQRGGSGGASSFSTISSAGGGGGAGGVCGSTGDGLSGGSGGGGGKGGPSDATPGGAGNTPPVSPPQGNNGGEGGGGPIQPSNVGGGGGGAGAVGGNASGSGGPGGNGGAGFTIPINGSAAAYAGGGGGQAEGQPGANQGQGGTGGGGTARVTGSAGFAGSTNTGGGGGGIDSVPSDSGTSGAGGSGIVIIRYKFQN